MSLAKKLQIKEAHKVRVVNAPRGFRLDRATTSAKDAEAVLVFVKDKAELEKLATVALDAALENRVSWVAYPKAQQLGTDLNRDILWKILAAKGVKPVRQVAIDDVWSALRFRPA